MKGKSRLCFKHHKRTIIAEVRFQLGTVKVKTMCALLKACKALEVAPLTFNFGTRCR
jgi:hypothetical protein